MQDNNKIKTHVCEYYVHYSNVDNKQQMNSEFRSYKKDLDGKFESVEYSVSSSEKYTFVKKVLDLQGKTIEDYKLKDLDAYHAIMQYRNDCKPSLFKNFKSKFLFSQYIYEAMKLFCKKRFFFNKILGR